MAVSVENDHARLRVCQRDTAGQVRAVLRAEGRPFASVDVTFTTDQQMRALNHAHRGVDAPTDVLSFALEDDPDDPGVFEHLGDVVVSLDAAQRQAAMVRQISGEGGYKLKQETLFLVTHGVLHLLGHDHEETEQALEMERLERALIASFTTVDVHAVDRSTHGL